MVKYEIESLVYSINRLINDLDSNLNGIRGELCHIGHQFEETNKRLEKIEEAILHIE